MAIFPVRELGKFGVLTDPDAYDLPTQAFSFGKNVRFRNGKLLRGPAFRNVAALDTIVSAPRFLAANVSTTGLDGLFICYKDGTVSQFDNDVETDRSISAYTPSDSEDLWTALSNAGVFYVNRENRVPWALTPGATDFVELANWTSTWRCKLLRSCSGSLVALGITKSGTSYPTMVKTSSFPTFGSVPSTWDETDTTENTTENIIAEMQGGIVDAENLGSSLVIYGSHEAWLMYFDGSQTVFSYRKLPFSRGAINANCSIEISGQHYVFGPDDIWKHDGVSDVSICEGRVREFIFNGINASKFSRCFVSHNPKLKEIHFHYVSGDRGVVYAGEGCNRAAVYNYISDTWTFDDLPLVFGAAASNLDVSETYATVVETYAQAGGTYQDQEDGRKKSLVYVGEASTAHGLTASLYGFDSYGAGSSLISPVDEAATADAYLERDGIDLDEVGVDLAGYKICHSVFPQGRLGDDAQALEFAFGAADYFNEAATFTAYQTYDGDTLYKLDFGQAGRYLSMRINFPDYREMSLSGFDLDLDVLGER